jgi:sugar lactone lactonase YvrE
MHRRPFRIAIVVLAAVAALAAPASAVEINKDLVQSWKVLVKGSPIHGANGLAFDQHDRLHIASVLGREIVVMDPSTGKILDRLGPALGVETPDDLTFGPSGDLFWTSIFTGEVGRLSPDGTKITAGQVFPGVNPITFSDDGRLFVAHDFFGFAGLYEIDPAGVDPPIELDPDFYNLNAFDFGPDGLLWGPIFQEKLIRIDVNSGPPPLLFDDILNPFASAAVKFDSAGRLHALNVDRVVRIDSGTGEIEVVSVIEPCLDNLAFDSRGNLYVSSFVNGTIFRVLPSGQPRVLSEGGMIAPGGVAVQPRLHGDEAVFVADGFSFREFSGRTGRPGPFEEVFASAQTVAAYGEDLIVSSWFTSAVEIRDGETLHLVDGPFPFNLPLNAIAFQGDIAVAELGTGSVVAGDGTPIASGLAVPTGLAATETELWVADWALGAVFKIVDGGTPITPMVVASGLTQPEGLAVNVDGSLLVVESGAGRLSRIDPDSGVVTTVAEDLELGAPAPPNSPPTSIFSGVAVGPSGNIYVTGDTANVLYRFQQHPRYRRLAAVESDG